MTFRKVGLKGSGKKGKWKVFCGYPTNVNPSNKPLYFHSNIELSGKGARNHFTYKVSLGDNRLIFSNLSELTHPNEEIALQK